MSSSRWRRDLRVFIMGTLLGILGNLFAEYWFALIYPKGISQMEAQIGGIIVGIVIMLYMIYARSILKED